MTTIITEHIPQPAHGVEKNVNIFHRWIRIVRHWLQDL